MKLFSIVAILTAGLNLGVVDTVFAQNACSEGRHANGKCINVAMGASARMRANINTHQKFSYSTRLGLPNQDRNNLVPFDYREVQRGVFSTSITTYSCHPNC